jgi:hypothetical protein
MAFEAGNKYAQEWNVENALPRFEDALKYAEDDDECLCLQDAIYQSGIPCSTFYYLSENHTVLETIKQDIHSAVIRRVNRLALARKEAVSPAAAIWRMKQLGEKDQQYIDQHTETNEPKINITYNGKDISLSDDI